ncbi:hypothetical protein T4A_7838 [Trichinella pseudospiralis]|uniref:Uncharacterized protein n=1 Tax=Trichinella pseudospiralis TaxID=6337 RepID=A0A0V1EIT5_TRIPS|nr:hypothetical protein T4A_7838 [Trichinella pseudospiralis]
MDILIQQVLPGNASFGDLRRVNSRYADKKRERERERTRCTIYGYSSGLAMLNFPVWCSMLSFNIVHFAVCQAIIRIKTDNTIFGNSSPYLPTYAIAEVPSSAFWLCRGWILLCQPPFCDWRVVHWPTAIMAHH